MKKLTDEIKTIDGDIQIITKTRFLFFFTRPRTAVIPLSLGRFALTKGFQVRYSTTDLDILDDLHNFFVGEIIYGRFEYWLENAKQGKVELPAEKGHLRQFIMGFNA